jgi:hypothetical protein
MNNRGFNLVIAIAIVIVALVVIGVVVAGSTGLVPIVSDLMGTNKPRELGVSFSETNYASGLSKVPGASVTNPQYLCIGCEYTSSGQVPTKTTFTAEEFSAMLNKRNDGTIGPVSDIEIKFNEDGTVETSAMVDTTGIEGVPELKGPIYAKGKIDSFTSKSLEIDLESAEFGRVGIPADQNPQVEDAVNEALKKAFEQNPGLSINNIEVTSEGLVFDGTLPESVEGNPNTELLEIN